MSDNSEDDLVEIKDIEEKKSSNKEKPTKEKKPMSAERLECLARARAKALEVRKANTELRGKKVVRDEKKKIRRTPIQSLGMLLILGLKKNYQRD